MSIRNSYGATEDDWDVFSGILGLTADLLPTVCNPHAIVSEKSSLTQIGKIPSIYNSKSYVVGIKNWTRKRTHEKEIALWRENGDYGICIQTREVRAFDIDVIDIDKAENVEKYIQDFIGGICPIRYRKDTGKRLLPVRISGEFGKRTVKVEGGIIEFLANGQQFIASGLYKTGKGRYEWVWPEEEKSIPELSEEKSLELWSGLCETFGIAPPTQKQLIPHSTIGDIENATLKDDEVSSFLVVEGHALGRGNKGQVFIECPFSDGHSSEDTGTSTAYFPKDTGGFKQGHFVCLHASCEDKTQENFLDAYDFRIKDLPILEENTDTLDLPNWTRNKSGNYVLAELPNIYEALKRPDIVSYTPFKDLFKQMTCFCDNRNTGRLLDGKDSFFVTLRRELQQQYNFKPISKELMNAAVLEVADENRIDSGKGWIDTLQWDGINRIETFFSEYAGSKDSEYVRSVGNYMWTALAGRILEPGIQADMVPVLVGVEGVKKTSVVSSIAPSIDQFAQISFGGKEQDTKRKMRGIVIAELAELKGLKTAEVEHVLDFITRRFEEWTPKYMEYSEKMPRRFIFVATTNDDSFLDGSRGNRRWLPIKAYGGANSEAIERDRELLWAEAKHRFKENGIMWQEAERLSIEERKSFEYHDPWEEAINMWAVRRSSLDGTCPMDKGYVTILEVLNGALNMSVDKVTRANQFRVRQALMTLGYYETRTTTPDGDRPHVWRNKTLIIEKPTTGLASVVLQTVK